MCVRVCVCETKKNSRYNVHSFPTKFTNSAVFAPRASVHLFNDLIWTSGCTLNIECVPSVDLIMCESPESDFLYQNQISKWKQQQQQNDYKYILKYTQMYICLNTNNVVYLWGGLANARWPQHTDFIYFVSRCLNKSRHTFFLHSTVILFHTLIPSIALW